MIRRFVVSQAILLLAISVMAQAPSDTVRTAKTSLVDAAVAERSRAEDLHILATIVTENVHGLYGVQPRVAGGTDATGPKETEFSAEGAWLYVAGAHPRTTAAPTRAVAEYLPDYGLVVQMEVPPPRAPVVQKMPHETPKPPSRWERTRQKLSGDVGASAFEQSLCSNCHDAGVKSDGGKAFADYDHDGAVDFYLAGGGSHPAPTRKQLADQLVETLAENGHNLRNLQANQRVTVSVTWQPAAVALSSHRFLNLKKYKSEGDGKFRAVEEKDKPTKPAAPKSPGGGDSSGASGPNPPRSNAELTGDLLLTKGRYGEAVQAFEQALRGLQVTPSDRRVQAEALAEQQKGLELKVAYAQAYLTAQREGGTAGPDPKQDGSKVADAKPLEHIEAVAKYENLLSAYKRLRKVAAGPAIPSRISITATKAQLDQVASGKLTREQFAQQVSARGFDAASGK
jgi:hypothetical protein